MGNQDRDASWAAMIDAAFAIVATASRTVAADLSESVGTVLYQFVDRGTETIGKAIAPIADNPAIKWATKVPGINWFMAALGQVNVEIVQQEVDTLRQQYPLDTPDRLAQRVIADTAWKAAGIGLVTNIIPPVALMLFAADLGAISALQAEMIYRIAIIYGFSPTDVARRGEVLAIWSLSTGSSGALKMGLSFVELLPGIGAVVGSAGDATLLYTLGHLACRFYEAKQKATLSTSNRSQL
ncbi:EcsC family protein [Chamaesiphon minutus]|uniref:DUF697 domain-containing protein n=1 Tax=Chamaesiphon minutus (strain ATCC 27169 / PCC 6605) TaxID=1173020 RepID=K9UH41_CHAP6|nr:EcsC family protein [Chamaesiphon minutus]AFY94135.1 protein of unknown function (DUF697) [Chamaesiphon minutus PCC 6605]